MRHVCRRGCLRVSRLPAVIAAAFALLAAGPAEDRRPPQHVDRLSIPEIAPQWIAVTPFVESTPDERLSALGFSDELTRALGRHPGLATLSTAAVAAGGVLPRSLDAQGRKLGVRYIVAGAIRRPEGRLQVSIQVADANEGRLAWRQRYDAPVEAVPTLAGRIAGDIAAALAVSAAPETTAATGGFAAYELVLQARGRFAAGGPGANEAARLLFVRALDLAPGHVEALVGLAETYLADAFDRRPAIAEAARAEVLRLAREAHRSAPWRPRAHALIATALAMGLDPNHEAAGFHARSAVRFGPSDPIAQAAHGRALLRAGAPEAAARALARAIRLDPKSPRAVFVALAVAYLLAGDYGAALHHVDRHFARLGDSPVPFALTAAANQLIGEPGRARLAAAELRRLYGGFDATAFAALYADPRDADALVRGLSDAGL